MLKFFGRAKDASDVSLQSFLYSPSPVTGPGRPIRLVYCDENGRFRMDPEEVATLQLVKDPIGIVSVCGRARQGKSFILNQIRDSIRALFPDRECFTLVRPVNNEKDLQMLEQLPLDRVRPEFRAGLDANDRADALSLQLQAAQAKLDALQQELTSVRLNETALDSKLKTASHGKRLRADDTDMETSDRILRVNKKSRSTTSPLVDTQPEDGGSVFKGDEDHQSQLNSQDDYAKFTVQKLKQELTKHNFGAELLALRNPKKKEILALYEKCILQKS